MKHVAANTIPKPATLDQIFEDCNSDHYLLSKAPKQKVKAKKMIKKHYDYLDQLINTDYGYYKSKFAATTEFIPEEMVQVDFKILGDRFLLFKIDELAISIRMHGLQLKCS